MWGVGLRVWGLGFRVWGLGFRARGLRFNGMAPDRRRDGFRFREGFMLQIFCDMCIS